MKKKHDEFVAAQSHAKLVQRAKQKGVSLNALVLAFIAEGIGKRQGKRTAR